MKQFSKSLAHQGVAKQEEEKQTELDKRTKEECKIFLYFLAQNITNFVDIETILKDNHIKNELVEKELLKNPEKYTKMLLEFKNQPQPKLPVLKFNLKDVKLEPHSLKLPTYMQD